MNLQKLLHRTVLMRCTSKVAGTEDCRTADVEETELDGRTTKVRELGFYLSDGDWAADPEALTEGCGTPGCVVHLVLEDGDAADVHVVAKSLHGATAWGPDAIPRGKDLRQLFRYGVSRGWFKQSGYRE